MRLLVVEDDAEAAGVEVPVGPNYRQDFERAIQMRDRWSA